jgi:hypothetical protein
MKCLHKNDKDMDMTKEQFLLKETKNIFNVYKKKGSYFPTFLALYNDGRSSGFSTKFGSNWEKQKFNKMMGKVCEKPEVVASIFSFEAWISMDAKCKNLAPSESPDRQSAILLIYYTPDGASEAHTYLITKEGLDLIGVNSDVEHLYNFTHPFLK